MVYLCVLYVILYLSNLMEFSTMCITPPQSAVLTFHRHLQLRFFFCLTSEYHQRIPSVILSDILFLLTRLASVFIALSSRPGFTRFVPMKNIKEINLDVSFNAQ